MSFRKRKGDEVDGVDGVAKKKSKKEKDKESKLEKALKVSPELSVALLVLSPLSFSFWEESSRMCICPAHQDLQKSHMKEVPV